MATQIQMNSALCLGMVRSTLISNDEQDSDVACVEDVGKSNFPPNLCLEAEDDDV